MDYRWHAGINLKQGIEIWLRYLQQTRYLRPLRNEPLTHLMQTILQCNKINSSVIKKIKIHMYENIHSIFGVWKKLIQVNFL